MVTLKLGELCLTWRIANTTLADKVTVDHVDAGGFALLHMRASGLKGAFIASEPNAPLFYGILFATDGRQTLRSSSFVCPVAAGDVIVWRSDVSCNFEVSAGIENLQLLVPSHTLESQWPALVPQGGCTKLSPHNALPSLARSFLETLWHQRDYLSSLELEAALHSVLDLLDRGQRLTCCNGKANKDLYSLIIEHIEKSLHEPLLSPTNIAKHFECSLRSLHMIFSKHGKTISTEIRNRRLERCRLVLAKTTNTPSISELAFEWGFSDAAHFSKLFKLKYGFSPRAYRKNSIRNSVITKLPF